MALKFKNPMRSRLKVTGSVVKTQQREGAAFYILYGMDSGILLDRSTGKG